MERAGGVLMHITSLPGPYGIGKFGTEAVRFARLLGRAGFTYWQVLPFTPVDESHSPYMAYSAFAGYIGLIGPEGLADEGLLDPRECACFAYPGCASRTDYGFAYDKALEMLRLAYTRTGPGHRTRVEAFAREHAGWLEDYALFMTIRERFGGQPFWLWPDPALKRHERTALEKVRAEEPGEVDFWKFAQYVFHTQWSGLKEAVNRLGIRVVGDMPIYVSMDSSDVWGAPYLFKLNGDLSPKVVAGVPPDYFSADGQLWGNPIYDWDRMEETGFAWWISRIREALGRFDLIRIDHFRGFESYWEVDAGSPTAVSGRWRKGPAMRLFNKVREAFGDAAIIAEDLGDISDGVRQFLRDSGFPGMKVLQFGFDPAADSEHLPHNYTRNCVAYTGTHDNSTLLGWLCEAGDEQRAFALRYCGIGDDGAIQAGGTDEAFPFAAARTLWQSPAALTILPVQDLCGLGADTRMNIPGTPSGNWSFRIGEDTLDAIAAERWRMLNVTYRRFRPDMPGSGGGEAARPAEDAGSSDGSGRQAG